MPTVAVGTPGDLQSYTAWLGPLRDGPDRGDGPAVAVRLVGGKGAALDRLARFGFSVPPAFCLTTDAFAAHLAGIADRERLERCLAALPAEAVGPDGRPTPALSRAIDDVKRKSVLELGFFLVIFTCMILMRFGL